MVFGSRSSQLWRWEGLFYHFSFTGLTQSCGHLDLLKISDSSISLAAVGLHLSDFQNRVAGHTAVFIASIQGFSLSISQIRVHVCFQFPVGWPRTEELFSRLFVDQNEILVFQNRRVL